MNLDIEWDRVSINGKEIRFQYPIDDSIVSEEEVILRLVNQNKPLKEYDFKIDDPGRNVVALTPTGELKWVIEPVDASDEDGYHGYLWTVQDRFLTGHTSGNIEFDPGTGTIRDHWSRNHFPIGDEIVELSGEVSRVVEFEDAIFLRCKQATHDLYAFETDGTERWRSDADERRGIIFVEDGELYERTAENRTTDHRYRLDPVTGERFDREVIDTGLW
ncbi:hypothetical protein ACNO8S_19850 (plasmid) [Haloarcula sp. KBTZ06]|uniref:hypothetical protein n=1 Tax=unclassified Haloarcula TaxID=2624677 RepID=UPI00300EFEE6